MFVIYFPIFIAPKRSFMIHSCVFRTISIRFTCVYINLSVCIFMCHTFNARGSMLWRCRYRVWNGRNRHKCGVTICYISVTVHGDKTTHSVTDTPHLTLSTRHAQVKYTRKSIAFITTHYHLECIRNSLNATKELICTKTVALISQ